MSKLMRAFMDLIEGTSKSSQKKGHEPEKFQRSEFKKLIEEELSPAKPQRTCSTKYKHMKNLPDSDTELMNEKEVSLHRVY